MTRAIHRVNTCLACGKSTLTPSHNSRIKKYCDNICQIRFEKSKGLRGNGTPKVISTEELKKLYVYEKKSCLQIAKIIGKSIRQVSRYLIASGIPTRPFSTKGLSPQKGKIMSKEARENIRKSVLKRIANGTFKSAWYIDGRTPKNKLIRSSQRYSRWRIAVFERDGYTCVWCKAKSSKGKKVYLNADHIKPFSQYPALRFSVDNGRTLCLPCHKKTDTFAGKLRYRSA